MPAVEVSFDGLVGPTHNYAALSFGNVASTAHGGELSSPRAAALQGIAKMRVLLELGVPQGVLPPHERPDVRALRRLGFAGSDAQVLARTRRRAPRLLAACSSASAMWAANAATVAPSSDTGDGRVHIVPANLAATLHRSLEATTTARVLRAIFPGGPHFAHHPALPASGTLGDEGAANHARLAPRHGAPGVHLFAYGRVTLDPEAPVPARFPARQPREASEAVARLLDLPGERVVLVQQAPAAIDAGAFHLDVVAVANENVLLHHEQAFLDGERTLGELGERLAGASGGSLVAIAVPAAAVSLEEAVATYLFNSQLVTLPGGGMALVAPVECQESPAVAAYLDALVDDPASPVRAVRAVDTRQSMRNGGGPACLRLRVVLSGAERAAVAQGVLADERLLARLSAWVERHHRDRLAPADLADPALLDESRRALDELTAILGLGAVYEFQRERAGPG